MNRNVCRCPYCDEVSACIDDDTVSFVLAPEKRSRVPCPHLALVTANLYAVDYSCEPQKSRSRSWLWARGDRTRQYPSRPSEGIASIVDMLAIPGPKDFYQDLTTEYRVDGGTVFDREVSRISGEFTFCSKNGKPMIGQLDGWGLYSESPDELVQEVRCLAESRSACPPEERIIQTISPYFDYYRGDNWVILSGVNDFTSASTDISAIQLVSRCRATRFGDCGTVIAPEPASRFAYPLRVDRLRWELSRLASKGDASFIVCYFVATTRAGDVVTIEDIEQGPYEMIWSKDLKADQVSDRLIEYIHATSGAALRTASRTKSA